MDLAVTIDLTAFSLQSKLLRSHRAQLFRLVLAEKIEMTGFTFLLLHSGHETLALPWSAML